MQRVILALAMGASAFENSYLASMSQRSVQANTATMDNARVAKDSASYLESLPQASTPTVEAVVAAPSYLDSLPSLEAAVAVQVTTCRRGPLTFRPLELPLSHGHE